MKKQFAALMSFVMLAFVACNDDDNKTVDAGAVAFSVPSVTLTGTATEAKIEFSEAAPADGSITVGFTTTGVAYGTDFTTDPVSADNSLILPFEKGALSVVFQINKLVDAIEGEDKDITFTITSVSLDGAEIGSNSSLVASFNPTASLGGTAAAAVGGSNQGNQVFFDLSSNQATSVARDSWELAFWSGAEFRVAINGAIKVAVKQLNSTNIDEVVTADAAVAVGTFEASNIAFVDAPFGNLDGTAIAAISDTDADNKVYLVNMGNAVPNVAAAPGSVNTSGDARGWKKIRILKSGNDYKLQYADIDATTHTEVTIAKDAAFHYKFFSLASGNTVSVEPQKGSWDIEFTTFTNEIAGFGSYFYSDFIINNSKAGVRAYRVNEADGINYAAFTLANVTAANFDLDAAKDQRSIGANWRSTQPLQLFTDRFFVVKDAAGNIYKLKVTQMQDPASNERGYPKFQYALLK